MVSQAGSYGKGGSFDEGKSQLVWRDRIAIPVLNSKEAEDERAFSVDHLECFEEALDAPKFFSGKVQFGQCERSERCEGEQMGMGLEDEEGALIGAMDDEFGT
jgi:hypothetical protein